MTAGSSASGAFDSDAFDSDAFDYVVVGAGSAGCVLASRLAAAGARVALLEAGGTDRRPDVRLPLGIASLFATANWRYPMLSDPSKHNQASAFASGRIIGGSGSINAMVYVRGRESDYRQWAHAGAAGWDHEDVLPAFRALENWCDGPDEYRGSGGPIDVSWCGHTHPLDAGFLDAAAEAGFARNPDHNGASQLGAGPSQVNQRRGLRCSAATGFLRPLPADRRPQVITRATVDRVVLARGRAIGVMTRGRFLRAEREVILSAGAIGTPAVLLRSGIGPGGTVADLPGVGQNLQDHLVVAQHWSSHVPTVNSMTAPGAVRAVSSLARRGSGPLTIAPFESQLFTEDFQIAMTPVHYQLDPLRGRFRTDRTDAFTVYTVLLRPRSRGHIELRDGRPVVHHHRLADAQDRADLLSGTALARELVQSTSAMRPMAGRYLDDTGAFDADWLGHKEASIYHAVGTCRMGDDESTVVGTDLRVHSVDGLRVADASIMPNITSGNTNAPSMMIGYRAADILLHG